MAEYIDRGVALDLVATEFGRGERGLEKAYHEIFRYPAADVRENVRAKWVEDRTEYVCSACGQRVSDEIAYMFYPSMALPGFCPNPACGAQMMEDAEDG